jgi:hypothetical protein
MITRNVTAFAAAIIAAATIISMSTPAEAQYRRRSHAGGAIAAGVAIGAIGLGAAAIASQRRGYYDDEAYYYGGRPDYGYASPTYYPRESMYGDERYVAPRHYYRRSPARDIYVDPYTGHETRLLR